MSADARLLLINAAEQLIAQHGYAALSLRQVGVVAGQRNNSAAQYHFGTKDGLLEAILTTRSERGEPRRRQLLAELDPETVTVRPILEALILPGAETLATAGYPSWIARFTDRMITDLSLGLIEQRWAEHFIGALQAGALLERALPEHDPRVVRQRLSLLLVLAARAFAHLESQADRGHAVQVEAIHRTADDLIDMGTVLLTKPA
ncbi:TetR family transcriptional regulator [Nocardia sp. NBC_01503]|uniref:TetR/AcrR family transcriptional regulator n=1 Tax=Nocardia sp. NBC_01503 TaxID=2975997 RepID=UPI002E7B980C|nr:TetR family transcriptional regulator [Nocardia sp. NBC_01503]WTL33291.1 TetR family transcriptional regulator [Nocardia sp. NBC_01503]